MPANGPVFRLKPIQKVRPMGTRLSWLLSLGSDVYRVAAAGARPCLPYPTRLNTPDSYCATWAVVSATTSTCTLVSAPVLPPYQPVTGAKSIDRPGVRAVILKGPLPIRVSGLANHESSPA